MTLLYGIHLDNRDTPPDSSHRRLQLARADLALTLWTAGTKHRRPVYQRLKRIGIGHLCIRVGDEWLPTSADAYLNDVEGALNEAVAAGYDESLIDCQLLNEPNLSGANPTAVGVFLSEVVRRWRRKARVVLPPVSRGKEGWQDYARAMLGPVGPLTGTNAAYGIHAYAADAEGLPSVGAAGTPAVVTEFSHPGLTGAARGRWVTERLRELSTKGYGYAVQFICDGVTGGAWDGNYRMTDEEAAYIGLHREAAMDTQGIDISNNNGVVDFDRLATSGCRFAFVKASEDDNFVDGFAQANLAGLKQLGWGRGLYHFARPSTASPAASVTLFQRAAGAQGWGEPGDVIALDIEDERVPEGQSLHQWVAEWLDLAERVFGVSPWKYSGRWYTSTRDLEHDDLAKYPTWWAAYQDAEPTPVTGWGPIRCWQNSSSGRLPGVLGDVDLDVFHGPLDDLKALGKPGAPVPQPAPAPDPVAAALADIKAATARLEAALAGR